MVDAYADPTLIVSQVVDSRESHLAQLFVEEVFAANLFRLTLRMPFSAVILEIPHQFLLFRVDGYNRLPLPLERPYSSADVLELGIAIGMGLSLADLPITLQAIIHRLQETGHRHVADLMALDREFIGQAARALASPKQGGFRMTLGRGLDQCSQVLDQPAIALGQPLTSASPLSNRFGIAVMIQRFVGVCSSDIPALMVPGESPVAAATVVIPPQPKATASVAAHRRRSRSSMIGTSTSNF